MMPSCHIHFEILTQHCHNVLKKYYKKLVAFT